MDDVTAATEQPTVITGEVLEKDPGIVFAKRDGIAALVAFVGEQVKAHVPDITTKAGRDAIASLAYKVARTKTLIDNTGKALTEDARKSIDRVNDMRRDAKEKLEALQAEARRPLDEWEAKEEKRHNVIRDTRQRLSECRSIPFGTSSQKIAAVMESVNSLAFDPDTFREEMEAIENEKHNTLVALKVAYDTAVKDEDDKRELARLKQQETERLAREAEVERQRQVEAARVAEEARIREEEAEKVRQQEREAAAAKEREAQAERDRIEAARVEAERAKERQRQEELDAAAERTRVAEAEAQRLRDVAAADERERQRIKNEEETRRRNMEYRAGVIERTKADIMNVSGISAAKAELIAQAIAAGSISNVEMKF